MAGKAGAIRAGRAFVELFADDSRLQRGLKRAQRRLRVFGAAVANVGTKLAALGTAALAPLGAAAKAFADAGDQLHKMSLRTGIGVESLSQLKFAAEQSGSNLDELGNAVLRMNRRLGRITAGQGEGSQVEALKQLGLGAEELERLSPEERLFAIADAMAAMEDKAEAAGLAQRAFGTQVDAILPLLLEGREGIKALTEEADELGLTMTQDQADAAANLTDAWNRVTRQLKQAVIQIGGALAPALTDLAERVTPVLRNVIDWVRENERVIVQAGALAAGVVALGGSLAALGTTISVVGTVLGALLSPIGLIIAGIGAMGAAFVAFGAQGDTLSEKLADFGDQFLSALEAIHDFWFDVQEAITKGIIDIATKAAKLSDFLEETTGASLGEQLTGGKGRAARAAIGQEDPSNAIDEFLEDFKGVDAEQAKAQLRERPRFRTGEKESLKDQLRGFLDDFTPEFEIPEFETPEVPEPEMPSFENVLDRFEQATSEAPARRRQPQGLASIQASSEQGLKTIAQALRTGQRESQTQLAKKSLTVQQQMAEYLKKIARGEKPPIVTIPTV